MILPPFCVKAAPVSTGPHWPAAGNWPLRGTGKRHWISNKHRAGNLVQNADEILAMPAK
jgi:hypothetical protein